MSSRTPDEISQAAAVLDWAQREPCPHGVPAHGYFVGPHPARGQVAVTCPCCHCPGVRDADDIEPPMLCPYCGVAAVVAGGRTPS